jgi:coenzyme F420-reducing hydrogenase beta subunit
MQFDSNGFLVPHLYGTCDGHGLCITVCPFNPYPAKEVETENELANIYLTDTTSFHPKIGKYHNIYVGHAEKFRMTSSSGGVATFILWDLLESGLVKHVFSVRESVTTGLDYEYAVVSNKDDLLASSKTKYYPVTLSSVFSRIDEIDGTVAVVGVACFIKAIRLAQYSDHSLKEKIVFLVGIICGGGKGRFFTEYLSSIAGVDKHDCYKPEFRIKDINSTASDYSFGCFSRETSAFRSVKMQSLGDMWGTGLFKANACDFCDDVTTELSDISLGDAWFDPYVKDGRGTNVVVTRSIVAEKIIQKAIHSNSVSIEELGVDKFIASLQGSFNHRQAGLSYRINHAIKTGRVIPPKRNFDADSATFDFKIVQLFRMNVRKSSIDVWGRVLDAIKFDAEMNNKLTRLKWLTTFYHFKRTFFTKTIGKKIIRRLSKHFNRQ